ncbi:uncharacterized protein LOC128957931 [Oppia nitens]|uniref:uncharacterized protein LOC128957931 n=1 Tax=Oppia nitens TaxID=1686743 RepID=UPI0023DBC8BC|nr:uncharacterized protein LOC128957931 [Oppia nitens]
MYKIFIVLLSTTYVYGYGSSGGDSYGSLSGGFTAGSAYHSSGGALSGLLASLPLGAPSLGFASGGLVGSMGLTGGHVSGHPVSVAVNTKRTFEVVRVPVNHEIPVPQVIDVEPSLQPVQVVFRSASSPVHVQQFHTPGKPGRVESTQSEDEPHRVLHEVTRPVIQEVREVIQPYRRVIQEVRPVVEEVHTVVAKGENRGHSGNSGHSANSGHSGGISGGISGHSGLGGLGAYEEATPILIEEAPLAGGFVGGLELNDNSLTYGATRPSAGGYRKKARRAKAAA